MSIYYDFTEVLEAHNIQENSDVEDVVGCMTSQLSLLSTVMVLNLVNVYEMKLVVDGKETCFKGDFYSQEIVDAIRSVNEANDLKLYICYSYMRYLSNADLEIGPFVMMKLLDEVDESVFKNLSYAAYNRADCDGSLDGGILCSYYYDGDKVHRGIANSREITEIPDDGKWDTPYTLWEICDAKFSGDDIEYLTNLIERMRPFAFSNNNIDTEVELDESGRCDLISMNYAFLSSKNEFDTFLGLMSELVKWHSNRPEDEKESFYTVCTFVDESISGPRILHVEFDDDGIYHLELVDAGFSVKF